jgi:hypothetical protein
MNNKKDGVSLAKGPAKGYVLILAVDLKIDGWERMGGREKELPVGNSSSRGGSPLPAVRISPEWTNKPLRTSVSIPRA